MYCMTIQNCLATLASLFLRLEKSIMIRFGYVLQYDLQSKERFSLMVKYASPHLILQID